MTTSELRQRLTPGATYSETWIGRWQVGPHTKRLRVISQGPMMRSEILDGPYVGTVVRLVWQGVEVSEVFGVVTILDLDLDLPFLQIDKIIK